MKTKKVIIIVVSVLVLMAVGAILIIKSNSSNKLPEFANKNLRLNDDGDEPAYIWFGKDGHFAYYWVSGSPVGSYDLCESYKYNEEEGILKLKCDSDDPEEIDNTIKIVSYDGSLLKLEIFDETLEFIVEE